MASRLIAEGSIVSRTRGLLQVGILKDAPVWLAVVERFPPLSPPVHRAKARPGRPPVVKLVGDELKVAFWRNYDVTWRSLDNEERHSLYEDRPSNSTLCDKFVVRQWSLMKEGQLDAHRAGQETLVWMQREHGAGSKLTQKLNQAEFNAERFVSACRRRVTLEHLRVDLEAFFKTLKAALVELINSDYADFVSLSAKLAGLESSIASLSSPLGQLREELLSVRGSIQSVLQAVEGKLQQRREVQEQKVYLERVVDAMEAVDSLEGLLCGGGQGKGTPVEGVVLTRAAVDFNHLQFMVLHTGGHTLVQGLTPRIQRVTQALQGVLEDALTSGLHAQDRHTLYECLQTYAIVSRQSSAEDMYRTAVRPYMEKVVTPKALVVGAQGLEGMLQEVLRFLPTHCRLLTEVVAGDLGEGLRARPLEGYDFVVRSVWPEVAAVLEKRVPAVFAAGNPETFYKNFSTVSAFLSSFERYCSSQASVARLRAHPSYSAFLSKWTLPVYFQLRFQDIAGRVEQALTEPTLKAESASGWQLCVFEVVWGCLHRCWQEGVFLAPLVHRFWKLTLQILSRLNSHLTGLLRDKLPTLEWTAAIEVTVMTVRDVRHLCNQFPLFLEEAVQPKLPLSQDRLVDVRAGVDECLHRLEEGRQAFATSAVGLLCRECERALEHVSTIPRLYRRTNKEVPAKPSLYVAGVLKPLQTLRARFGAVLGPEEMAEWCKEAIASTTRKYLNATSDLLTSVKKTEDSLSKLKRSRRSTVAAAGPAAGVTDDNKIRLQIALDVEAYAEQVRALDCDAVTLVDQLVEVGQTAKAVALAANTHA